MKTIVFRTLDMNFFSLDNPSSLEIPIEAETRDPDDDRLPRWRRAETFI